jgi:hypothetical protein
LRPVRELQRLKAVKFTECVDYVGVVPSVRSTTNIVDTFEGAHQRLPIQARSRNSVEGIGYGENASSKWDYIAPQACWIARTIPPLMMVSYERCYLSKRRVLSDHVCPDVGVAAHDFPLVFA